MARCLRRRTNKKRPQHKGDVAGPHCNSHGVAAALDRASSNYSVRARRFLLLGRLCGAKADHANDLQKAAVRLRPPGEYNAKIAFALRLTGSVRQSALI